MKYKYNKLKFIILVNIFITILPILLVLPITYIMEKGLIISKFHYILLLVWFVMLLLSFTEINQSIRITRSQIIRKSLFVEIAIDWDSITKVNYIKTFNIVTIYSGKSQITLNSAYKDYQSMYKTIHDRLITHNITFPDKFKSDY
jgi:hypothetical protein